jgi:hypothetical protein
LRNKMPKSKHQKKKRSKKSFNVETWLKAYIIQKVNEMGVDEYEDCVDNLRWAALGDAKQMKVYETAEADGCCGSFDGEVLAPDGITYKVGCNYGH